MSDKIKHECGVALIRLLKPLEYYQQKYGTAFYGINKLYLLMEKQHNRGQDGAGAISVKFDTEPGTHYRKRYRSIEKQSIQDVFEKINEPINELRQSNPEAFNDVQLLKKQIPFLGELYLGHLRYGTFGKNSIEACHPFIRQNNWKTRTLAVAGNFNMTNVDELLTQLVNLGQHPSEKADTVTVLENIGHFLDEENELQFKKFKQEEFTSKEISPLIGRDLDIQRILRRASKNWDGGYVICGLLGHGDAFVMRDPNGIRPVHYFANDEVIVVASERPALQTAFNVPVEDISEIPPGNVLIIKKSGAYSVVEVKAPQEKKSCSFERIYFSRGSDVDIYKERKELGRRLCPVILEAIDYDLKHTVFSYIPNTAETAFYGMVKGMEDYLNQLKIRKIAEAGKNLSPDKLSDIINMRPRIEKIAIKDAKLRTFITDDAQRDDLVAHVYDITYGTVERGVDTLVVIDDSIVRGTTLKKSILKILDRLGPKKIVIVSSAPQIRYPDCYGIDMARLGDFIAFQATMELLDENNMEQLVDEVYHKCKEQLLLPKEQIVNHVKRLFEPFTDEQISKKISQILRPADISASVEIVYQSVDDLHKAIPNHIGDWYFTGDYPTPGGNKVACRAFVNYMEGRNERAY